MEGQRIVSRTESSARDYIGLACSFHDPGLAVVNSAGRLVFAEATERHLQSKRAFNCSSDTFPYANSVVHEYCDPHADVVVAKTWTNRSIRHHALIGWGARMLSRVLPENHYLVPALDSARWLTASMGIATHTSENVRRAYNREGLPWQRLKEPAETPAANARKRRVFVTSFDHHLTHAAAGCYTCPFPEAVCAVVDGYGETGSTAFFHYRDGRIQPIRGAGRSSVSLGWLYAQICQACGFDPELGEEWKVMGLAPYGRVDEELLAQFKAVVRVDGLRFLGKTKDVISAPLWRRALECSPGDLAATGQAFFEHCMVEILTNLARLGLSKNLVFGGGCALNSSFNGLILDRTSFEKLHVFAAPADDGNAVGAAFLAYDRDHPGTIRPTDYESPYLGSCMSQEVMDNLLRFDASGKVSHHPGTIHEVTAQALAAGKIVGWVQGRAEFGPRALGNRSILADPRQAEMKDRINSRVKFREEFRPFAPSIMDEYGEEYFEHYQQSPYMERTLMFRKEVMDKVPGVVHVNGTGRLQTVRREWNQRYYELIEAFHRITGIPLVLNTSFNIMGKPIIHSVEDAVATFRTTGLDVLVIGDYFFEK